MEMNEEANELFVVCLFFDSQDVTLSLDERNKEMERVEKQKRRRER